MAIPTLAVLMLTGCAEATPGPISSDRTIRLVKAEVQVEAEETTLTLTSTSTSPLYVVSGVWLQERYTLERSLRLRLERCSAELGRYQVPTNDRPDTRTVIPWPLLVPFRQPALNNLVHP